MLNIYDEEALEKVEEDEHSFTEEALLVFLALMSNAHTIIEDELRSFYQTYGKDGVVTYAEARKWISNKDRRRRLNVLLFSIFSEFNVAHCETEIEFRTMLKKVSTLESKFFGVEIDFDKLSLKWGYDDLDWVDRLRNDVIKWSSVIQSDVKRGILQRKNLNSILADIDKRFESINKVLETLSISETTATGSIVRHKILDELGIKEYKFYTRHDEQTCEICGPMHGKVFPMSAYEVGVTASPMHPRCRCWEVPIKSE